MNKNIDPSKLQQFFGNNGTEAIKKASTGDTASLISSLNPEEKELLSRLMKDKEARDKLLSSPEVAQLISLLMNGR